MNKKKFKLDNLYEGLEVGKEKIAETEKEQILIDDFLRTRFGRKRVPQIREGISLPIDDINFVKKLRERLITFDPKIQPNKSQLYRLGLRQLRDKTDKELYSLYWELLKEMNE